MSDRPDRGRAGGREEGGLSCCVTRATVTVKMYSVQLIPSPPITFAGYLFKLGVRIRSVCLSMTFEPTRVD